MNWLSSRARNVQRTQRLSCLGPVAAHAGPGLGYAICSVPRNDQRTPGTSDVVLNRSTEYSKQTWPTPFRFVGSIRPPVTARLWIGSSKIADEKEPDRPALQEQVRAYTCAEVVGSTTAIREFVGRYRPARSSGIDNRRRGVGTRRAKRRCKACGFDVQPSAPMLPCCSPIPLNGPLSGVRSAAFVGGRNAIRNAARNAGLTFGRGQVTATCFKQINLGDSRTVAD